MLRETRVRGQTRLQAVSLQEGIRDVNLRIRARIRSYG